MEFEVNLIVVSDLQQTKKAKKYLSDNCTHIIKNVYLMEGDLGCLLDDDVDFNFIEIGVVGGLGGLNQKGLLEVCDDSFSVDVRRLKYNSNEKYKESLPINQIT